ncbi:lysylphosphatidylglycerol synthase transmembrane domain-containing protein [Rhizobium helianthi]|uniref:Lysylphosphatidylglycerol synthase transmembrane domain-containing protein n=1 Tax=Rhizobium helianthi TaxID=1132695 RepID=A0ABW4M390_9HYPH
MSIARFAGTVVALVALFFLVRHLDLSALWHSLSRISWADILLGLLIVQCQIILSALRWRFTAARLGLPLGWLQAVREYYVATAFNQLLPGGVAGDAMRAYRVSDAKEGGFRRSGLAVIMERASGQVSLLMFAILGFVLWPEWWLGFDRALLTVLIVMGVATVLIVLSPVLLKRLEAWRNPLMAVFWNHGGFFIQMGFSLAITASYVALFMVCAEAVGAPLNLIKALMIVPLTLLSMVIPSGFGGWGTREATAAALWPLAGLASAQGVATSIVYGALALAGAAPGLIFVFMNRKRSKVSG